MANAALLSLDVRVKGMKIKWLIPIFTSFGVFLACVYNLAYWGAFNVNALEFLSLNELALTSVKAYIWMALVLLGGVIIATEMAEDTRALEDRGEHTRAKMQDWVMNGLAVLLPIGGVWALFVGNPLWPFLIFPGVGGIVAYWISQADWIPEEIASKRTVFLAIFLSIFLAFSAYGRGLVEADTIISGSSYMAQSKDACADRFVGKIGDVVVFFRPEVKSTRISMLSSVQEISLYPMRNAECNEL